MNYLLEHINLIQQLIIVLLVILFAVWNGLIANWKLAVTDSEVDKWSKLWHKVAMTIRILVILLLYPNIKLMVILGWFSIISYDIIIALVMKQKWYYIGETATIDKLGTKVNYGLRILLTVGVITYLILTR